ncbi:MAG TPA: hypothetical protein VFM46_20165 [Pseudomonadales bacterium]|nr:hypothetical protein [Pseudomonadales bacterium]
MHPLAAQLLELQLQYELKALSKEHFAATAREFVADVFALTEQLTLNQVMTPEQIMGVIQRNVVELEINGGLIELIGEATAEVRAHIVGSGSHVQDVLDRSSFEEYVNKVFDLFQERGELLQPVLATPVYSQVLSDILLAVLNQYFRVAHKRGLTIPLIGDLIQSGEKLVSSYAPELSARLEESVKHFTVKNLKWLISKSQSIILEALSDPELRESVLTAWGDIGQLPVGQFDETLQSLDLSEFLVIGFEHWKRFRTTSLLIECCEVVVNYLFSKFGNETLAFLLSEVGVSETQAITEVEALAPRALNALLDNGFIETLLRKRLTRFYETDSVTLLLSPAST